MKQLDLDDEYETFMSRVNPTVAAHSVQYRESRRAFFAGATAMFFHAAGEITQVSDEEGVAEFERIRKQLIAFKVKVAQDKD